MNPYIPLQRTKTITDRDIEASLQYLRGGITLIQLREQLKLTTSSCYSFTLRCVQAALNRGRIKIKY